MHWMFIVSFEAQQQKGLLPVIMLYYRIRYHPGLQKPQPANSRVCLGEHRHRVHVWL